MIYCGRKPMKKPKKYICTCCRIGILSNMVTIGIGGFWTFFLAILDGGRLKHLKNMLKMLSP
jgi:hypothetical protein